MKAIRSLYRSLRSLRGNQRACVFTEPLWAIPYQLFLPFASLYMSDLGLTDAQIGTVAALGFASQFAWALLSGGIVDKIGRRKSMLLFGLMSWTIPCALWMSARSFPLFALAAAFNGMWRVTGTSFSCLIVEDGDDDKLVHIFTILSIMGMAAGFLAPVAGIFIVRFSLPPTMRALYALALLLMTAKFILQYRMSGESSIGRARIAASRGCSALHLALGNFSAFVSAIGNKSLLLLAAFALLINCDGAVFANFWPLFVTEKYGISAAVFSALPPAKAIITLVVYLLIIPHIKLSRVRVPLLSGIAAKGLSLALPLALLPLARGAVWVAFLSASCDAFALAMLGPYVESLISVTIPQEERARINSMMTAGILLVGAPVTWLAGLLAELNRSLPLAMGLGFVVLETVVALRFAHRSTAPFPTAKPSDKTGTPESRPSPARTGN